MATKRFRAEEGLDLAEIKLRMDAMGERELESWILTAPLPDAVLTALGHAVAAGNPTGNAALGGANGVAPTLSIDGGTSSAATEGASAGNPTQATWYHVELLPGLVLQLSANASPAVKSAAKRILAEYVGS